MRHVAIHVFSAFSPSIRLYTDGISQQSADQPCKKITGLFSIADSGNCRNSPFQGLLLFQSFFPQSDRTDAFRLSKSAPKERSGDGLTHRESPMVSATAGFPLRRQLLVFRVYRFRQTPGARPVCSLNTLLKWNSLEKPHSSAIRCSRSSVPAR